jgi:hypothetical protein
MAGWIYRRAAPGSSYPRAVTRILLATLLTAACAGRQPEPAPAYTPVASPEAPTSCPAEAAVAKRAREQALDDLNLRTGEAAAQAVYKQAECERQVFDKLPMSIDDLSTVTAAREQLETVRNLYDEVVNHGVPRWVVMGHAQAGNLYVAYAERLRGLGNDPEIGSLAAVIEADGFKRYQLALDASATWPELLEDRAAAQVLNALCATLRSRSTGNPTVYKACQR